MDPVSNRRPIHQGARIPSAAKYQGNNRLLAALSARKYRELQDGLERVELPFAQVLYEPGDAPAHVYFPEDCLISLVVTGGARALEVGLVGRESMVGVQLALGRTKSSVRALVQGGGSAMRMRAGRFTAELAGNGEMRREVDRCIYVAMATAMQIAACNNLHVLAPRLARWLLMVRDRAGVDQFRMTHEFLATMLGVRRAGVTGAATGLQRRGMIRYHRGKVEVIDLQALRGAACSCYRMIRKLEEES